MSTKKYNIFDLLMLPMLLWMHPFNPCLAQNNEFKNFLFSNTGISLIGPVRKVEEIVFSENSDLRELQLLPDEFGEFSALAANDDTLMRSIVYDSFGYVQYDSSHNGLETYSYHYSPSKFVKSYTRRIHEMFFRQPSIGWQGGSAGINDSTTCVLSYEPENSLNFRTVKIECRDAGQSFWNFDYDNNHRIISAEKFSGESSSLVYSRNILYGLDDTRIELSRLYGYNDSGRFVIWEQSKFFDRRGFVVYWSYKQAPTYSADYSHSYEAVYVNDDLGNPIVTTIKPEGLPICSIRSVYLYDNYKNWIERNQQYEFNWAVGAVIGKDSIVRKNENVIVTTRRTITYH